MAGYNVAHLLIIGLLFHLIFIYSVFDCYFTSPVVHGMSSFNVGYQEAKRLVLIVGDGLRADLLFEPNGFSALPNTPDVVAPHIRAIIEHRGAFGVSHTRVPTESRPGHVAIIGGMYEDVSAVAKGWKTNPVDFDSVFNQSSHTYSFGSPDILPMFTRGAVPGVVKEWSYDEDAEDFTQDATKLDLWVLEHLRVLFRNATTDPTLDHQLRSDKVVIFMHLLGLDTTGHSYRPHSLEYMNNIQVVDGIVKETENLISNFFQDKETSYIFTADHGMSVIGNHGDGNPDSTRTPLVAWGKGIRGPLPDSIPSSHDSYSRPWALTHLYRRDVEQADIAALMATLIGIDWPVNSVGVLPDVDPMRPGYLLSRDGDQSLAEAALINAKTILENYRIQHEIKKRHKNFYRPFAPLEAPTKSGNPRRIEMIQEIEDLILQSDWYGARAAALDLITIGLEGLRFLQTYERTLLRTIATIAYAGWAAYASLFVFKPGDFPAVRQSPAITATSFAVLASFWGLFFSEQAPWTYYLYVSFPCYFWQRFLSQILPLLKLSTLNVSRQHAWTATSRVFLVFAALISMVVAYTHRSIWSIGFFTIGFVWPVFWSSEERVHVAGTRWLWMTSCTITAIFPLLSVDKTETLSSILLGGAGMLLAGAFMIKQVASSASRSLLSLFYTQCSFIVITMIVTSSSVRCLQAKTGLPLLNQISGWVVLFVSSLLPFISRVKHSTPVSKILMYFLGFGPCFVILSISVEGMFYVAYSMTLLCWIEVESSLRSAQRSKPENAQVYRFQADDLRIVLFFLFFVQVGFFGTGNVASVSSFYLSPVYRLIPIFNPFYMSALLLFKIVAPYIILSVVFATLTYQLHLPPFALFLNALMITDGMTVTFFFNVTDTGSWLEIGQTISFFVVASLLLAWSGGICAGGEYLMADVLIRSPKHRVD
ncbi:Phosphatidylinositolglycan class N-domain-containing protein [Armillaria novae-zelandiae]|uniref:GPI ethanolamine phosphate transferase 1 n=1 Tax=Armillaria novae-zelandiae TaxID=153914 RepID=A0AA39PC93_9AGAR|nr:Phosphatidylinositolglycan class N-domain-containing protein [Armillaria novae-zelandiae]